MSPKHFEGKEGVTCSRSPSESWALCHEWSAIAAGSFGLGCDYLPDNILREGFDLAPQCFLLFEIEG